MNAYACAGKIQGLTPELPALKTAKEFAAILGVSLRTIDSMDRRGELPACLKIGRSRRWRAADIQDWIEERLRKEAAHQSKSLF